MTPGHAATTVWTSLAVCLSLSVTACASGSRDTRPAPATAAGPYVARQCPPEVTAALVGTVECGTLTVPENRTDHTGRVRLLVTSLTPAEVRADDPIVIVGTDIATRPNYAGMATLSQRAGRRVVILEQRGTGHSEPSLACPQPDDPSERLNWSDRTGSRSWLAKTERLASTCFRSLESRGVDVASYGVTEMAADVVDLISALHLAPVNVVTYGSASRIVFELLRSHADVVRAVVLDTPDVPGFDPRPVVPDITTHAIAQVLRWCDQDRDCRSRYPDPSGLADRAFTAVADRPMPVRVDTQGSIQRVVLDAALLARVARQTLTDGGSAGSWGLPKALPALLTAVSHRDRGQVASALSELLGVQGPLCPGYRAKCMSAHVVDEGVFNTVLCRDILPNAADAKAAPSVEQGIRRAYDRSWWWDVCAHWPVATTQSGSPDPVRADVPVLVLAGDLAPSTPEHAIRAATRGLRNVSIIVAPTGSHNVVGQRCLNQLRSAWLDDLRPRPKSPRCIEHRVEW